MRSKWLTIPFSALVALILGVASLEISSYRPSPVTAMYVLGDSSVDCGDNTLFYSLLGYNLSLHPCNGSNSILVPQLLAEKMRLKQTIPFYNQNGSLQEIQRGINFGSAQATIMSPSSQSHQSLSQQLRQALEIIQLLQLILNQETAIRFIRSSIFYISFGKNDYINFLYHNSTSRPTFNPQMYAWILADQMTTVLRNLYDANVRKIVCMGILPLGCTPRTVWEWTNNNSRTGVYKRGCVDDVNRLVLEYNILLERYIVDLDRELAGAKIIFCDVYRAVMEFIANPSAYGFVDVQSACCGVGKYGSEAGCTSMDSACQKASTHVWWDLYNPTQAVNHLIAEAAWSGHPLPAICRPVTIQVLMSIPV